MMTNRTDYKTLSGFGFGTKRYLTQEVTTLFFFHSTPWCSIHTNSSLLKFKGIVSWDWEGLLMFSVDSLKYPRYCRKILISNFKAIFISKIEHIYALAEVLVAEQSALYSVLPTNLKSFLPDQPKNSANHKIDSH
jgi:hypothetical protein